VGPKPLGGEVIDLLDQTKKWSDVGDGKWTRELADCSHEHWIRAETISVNDISTVCYGRLGKHY
jgi:hypothetical protein